MTNQVFANNREVSCKSAAGKSICAFPDVCFTPPLTPATPPGVPIPYPNTGMASDTSNGSTSVKISGKEVMLKDKSYFKRSMGDEAGCAPKKGVITSRNMGKVFFTAWSMDVKIEGENVVRMMDLTTHNHGSNPGNTGPWPYLDEVAMPGIGALCGPDKDREEKACEGCKPKGNKPACPPYSPPKPPASTATSMAADQATKMDALAAIKKAKRSSAQQKELESIREKVYKATPEYEQFKADHKKYFEDMAKATESDAYKCARARRCMLVPFKSKDKQQQCCEGQTGHHLIEASAFLEPGTRGKGDVPREQFKNSKYDINKAPCICAEGQNNTAASHGLMHTYQGVRAEKIAVKGEWTLKQATDTAGQATKMVFPNSDCSPGCISAQLKAYHEQEGVGVKPGEKIPASPSGKLDDETAKNAWKDLDQRAAEAEQLAKNRSSNR
ncbi:PAAR-like domain-containing protein [Rhizobacter sp. Root1221]|uniref:PAAR-like domain-containing protein n=1 Tax=Rhizobacter sp. Root1221 TaxID=1736433 RepID=UPI0006FA5E92|nr:PAAR-like domain-containing protein [Rhizobacter sp. Root1221]KQV96823.1 hypothetical protein ASC87_24830 [Rhizobacter sp. Root1221]